MIDLNPQIVDRLKGELGLSERGEHLRGGRCPSCDKKTLWTWTAKPGRVQCDRTNNCGWDATTKELFPDLFEKINEKYQPTESNPNATADAYLSILRGLNPAKINGWYSQGKYWHPRGNRGTATVRFFLDDAKTIMWERLIDDVAITDEDGDKETRNKNFKGSFRGLWWQPPGLEINKGDEVWWCEGILDAIALNLNGIKAVAIMSSGTFPCKSLEANTGKQVNWILALDNDTSGRKSLHKHAKKLSAMGETFSAALSSEGEEKADWNDLHQAKKLAEKEIAHYRHLGQLELASSYREKAQLIWMNRQQGHFIFSHAHKTYSAKIDHAEYQKVISLCLSDDSHMTRSEVVEALKTASKKDRQVAKESAFSAASKIKSIATFQVDFLYFQKPDNGEDGQYFFQFKLANGSPISQLAFTHKNIAASADFKKSAMRIPGAQFTGSTGDLDILYREWTHHVPKVVRTLDFIGYDRDSNSYVYSDYAVEAGRVIKVNKQSYFQVKSGGIKTLVDIRQTLSDKNNTEWVGDFLTAFGTKGLVALSWWFGSLFVEQIRKRYQSYPFFEVVGEAASGKTSLVDIMWRLLGKEGESFNPNDSTLAGRTRKMAEVSNMPVVFNETDNEESRERMHVKKFNWDEQKDLFDGEFGRVTGVKSQDNQTRKPRFKAGLMIVQNIPVQASEAIMTRICHLNFDSSHHSSKSKAAMERLRAAPIKNLSGFVVNSVKQADRVLKHFDQQLKKHIVKLQKSTEIKSHRILENHAKISAFTDCLAGIYPEISADMVKDAHAYIERMTTVRQAVVAQDNPLVQQFWAQLDYLDNLPADSRHSSGMIEDKDMMNHSNQPDSEIAVNLEHFHQRCRENNLPTLDNNDLRRHLKGSRHRKFVKNESIRSAIEKRTVRCWVFSRSGGTK